MDRQPEFTQPELLCIISVSLIFFTIMKEKKIILAGGTGFLGQEMTKYFGKENKIIILTRQVRSEERRVGKECRARWSPYHEKKKKSTAYKKAENFARVSKTRCIITITT